VEAGLNSLETSHIEGLAPARKMSFTAFLRPKRHAVQHPLRMTHPMFTHPRDPM